MTRAAANDNFCYRILFRLRSQFIIIIYKIESPSQLQRAQGGIFKCLLLFDQQSENPERFSPHIREA